MTTTTTTPTTSTTSATTTTTTIPFNFASLQKAEEEANEWVGRVAQDRNALAAAKTAAHHSATLVTALRAAKAAAAVYFRSCESEHELDAERLLSTLTRSSRAAKVLLSNDRSCVSSATVELEETLETADATAKTLVALTGGMGVRLRRNTITTFEVLAADHDCAFVEPPPPPPMDLVVHGEASDQGFLTVDTTFSGGEEEEDDDDDEAEGEEARPTKRACCC
jgi:hypothetical protein